jgi:hypothetical protein
VLPSAAVYRDLPSPPLRAVDRAVERAAQGGGVLVVDRTLHAFVGYREAMGPLAAPVVFDHLLSLGATPSVAGAVVVFDGDNCRAWAATEDVEVFSCDDALLRSMGQGRFLDVTVAGFRSTRSEGVEDLVAPFGKGPSGGRQDQGRAAGAVRPRR